MEKEKDIVKFLEELGGVVVGSRLLKLDHESLELDLPVDNRSDWNIAFIYEFKYEHAINFMKILDEGDGISVDKDCLMFPIKGESFSVGGVKFSLMLVDKIAHPRDQLEIHLRKEPEHYEVIKGKISRRQIYTDYLNVIGRK